MKRYAKKDGTARRRFSAILEKLGGVVKMTPSPLTSAKVNNNHNARLNVTAYKVYVLQVLVHSSLKVSCGYLKGHFSPHLTKKMY